MQTCIWPSWCHWHSLSLAPVKSRLVLPFWYQLTWVVLEKGPLNGCVCVKRLIYKECFLFSCLTVYILTTVLSGCTASTPVIGWRLSPSNSTQTTHGCGVGHMTALVFQMHAGRNRRHCYDRLQCPQRPDQYITSDNPVWREATWWLVILRMQLLHQTIWRGRWYSDKWRQRCTGKKRGGNRGECFNITTPCTDKWSHICSHIETYTHGA